MHLTVAYITSRKEPHLDWFFDSLLPQSKQDWDNISVVVVDLYAGTRTSKRWILGDNINYHPPKPCVWQGPHRLTKEDWFAASNARNTALCLARDGFIAFVDDLSVLMPNWLKCVKQAMAGNYVVCGAYRKVKDLVVENGEVKSFTGVPEGIDRRTIKATRDVGPCVGECLFGCSVAGPVNAFLSVNGWPEDLCDGMGYEDMAMGVVLRNGGQKLYYDRRMMTYESIEGHFTETPPRRADPGKEPNDKSHVVKEQCSKARWFANPSIEGGIAALRRNVLNGGQFPIRTKPDVEWFSGVPLSEL